MIRTLTLFDDYLLIGLDELFKRFNKPKRRLDINKFLETEEVDLSKNRVIGKFITNNSDLKSELLATEKIIDTYFNKPIRTRPLNILLSASPGSGKSFLLKQFKKKYNTDYEEFNLSTLLKKDEVFEIFRFIKDRNKNEKIPIIFIDEVDTVLNNEYIFPYLISAMSDGKSRYNREIINCDEAVLAFAGSGLFERNESIDEPLSFTKNRYHTLTRIASLFFDSFDKAEDQKTYYKWREKKIETLKKNAIEINKFPDFLDRIDLFLMLPPTFLELDNYSLKQELLDLSVSLIDKHLSVDKVEFYYLLVIMTLIFSFESKREAESVIFITSIPKTDILKFEDLPLSIRHKFETLLVNIDNTIIKIKT